MLAEIVKMKIEIYKHLTADNIFLFFDAGLPSVKTFVLFIIADCSNRHNILFKLLADIFQPPAYQY